MELKVIVTGATGMVGEGVLLTCLEHPNVTEVLMVNRKHYDLQHPKLKECIIPDFFDLTGFTKALTGYNACFYCAGISSAGMSEKDYHRITYDTALHFTSQLALLNPGMILSHISGSHTDSSAKGPIMWARVKGKAENALLRLPFQRVYHFRPGFMKPVPGQKNIKTFYKVIVFLSPLLRLIMPKQMITMRELGLAMINSIRMGYPKQILEISDIKILAKA